MVTDSAERGRSLKGVVGAAGSERRYRVNKSDRSAGDMGVPQSFNACVLYSALVASPTTEHTTDIDLQSTSPTVDLSICRTPNVRKSTIGILIPAILS